jgi:hypothetical protein
VRQHSAFQSAIIDAAVRAIASSSLVIKSADGKTLATAPVKMRRSADGAALASPVQVDIAATGYPSSWCLVAGGVSMLSGSVGDEINISDGELIKGGRFALHDFTIRITL